VTNINVHRKIAALFIAAALTRAAPVLAKNDHEITIIAFGENLDTQTPAVIKNDRVFLPVRDVGTALGAEVGWDGDNYRVVFIKNSTVHTLFIGSPIAYKSHGGVMSTIQMEEAPFIMNDRALAPLRYLAESFDYDVTWDESSKTVSISDPVPEDLFADDSADEEPSEEYEPPAKRSIKFDYSYDDDFDAVKIQMHESARYLFERDILPNVAGASVREKLRANDYDGMLNIIDAQWLNVVTNELADLVETDGEDDPDAQSQEWIKSNLDYYELNPRETYELTIEYPNEKTAMALLDFALIDERGYASFAAFTDNNVRPGYFVILSEEKENNEWRYGFYRFEGASLKFVKDIQNDARSMIEAINEELA
jgi:hypothetical protein